MKRLDRILLVGALAVIVATPTLVAASRESVAATEPTDAEKLAILWADYCERTEDEACTDPTATPAPSASPTSTTPPSASATPSATPSVTPSSPPPTPPTPTSTPAPSATSTPVSTATPSPTSTPTTTPPPTPPTDGFIGPEVAGLPTSGSAWTAIVNAANASPGTPNITCDQNQRAHPGAALASGLVYARTGDNTYRTRAISLIEAARATARDCGNAILSLGRQLGAYILAADYVGYRDASFVSWVRAIRDQNFPGSHGRWKVLSATAGNTSSNWGIFALASLTAADAYLGDSAGLARDWGLFVDYGDGSSSFQHTSSYQAVWACPVGYEINPASCTDPRKEGAAVEDASRTSFPSLGGYPAEAAQGYVLQAELLAKAGYAAWTVNDAQVCRNAEWRERGGNLNYSSADRYVTWMTNARCGLNQPTQPAPMGRVFGYADWLFQ